MAPRNENDFDVAGAIKKVEQDNDGINFDNKVKESIRRSVDVHAEIKCVVWSLLKEKVIWVVLGAFSFVLLEMLRMLLEKLISKI